MSDAREITQDDFGGDDLIAAEFALGLLELDLQSQMARRVRIDQGFAALVEDWEIRFSQLIENIAPVAPPPMTHL